MQGSRLRTIVTIAGWALAAVLLAIVLLSRYDISLVKRDAETTAAIEGGEAARPPEPKSGAARTPTTASPAARTTGVKPREISTTKKPEESSKPPSIAEILGSAEAPAAPASAAVPAEVTPDQLFKLAAPSVVLIEVFNEQGQKSGTGSGFIASANGSVVTNYHVIRGAHSAQVKFADGSTGQVTGVVGFDRDRDVAVIRIWGAGGLQPTKLGDSDKLQVGQRLVAIGSPRGLQNTLTDGLVSGIREGFIQMSTPISPGSSGGPVFNQRGEVVGVAVATLRDAQNLNFAVPINWAKRYLTGTQVMPLTQVAQQSVVVQSIANQTYSVPAGQRLSWTVNIDPNQMTSPELQGKFAARGGVGDNIRVLVVSGDQRIVYDSGRVIQGEFRVPLPAPGTYHLVIDNSGSMMFPRDVTTDFRLRYTR